MIDRIENRTLRRVALVAALPVLLPLQVLIIGAAAVYDDLRHWPAMVREVWSK